MLLWKNGKRTKTTLSVILHSNPLDIPIHTDSGNNIATVGISKQKEEHNDKQ